MSNNNCECCSHWSEWLYTAFRIIIGGLFMWHGISKFMSFSKLDLLMKSVAIVETASGALILIGLYASYAAIAGAIVMIGALVKAHLVKGFIFVGAGNNGGEAALLFLAAFLAIYAIGNGKCALQNVIGCSSCCESGSCDMKSEMTEAPVTKKKSHKK